MHDLGICAPFSNDLGTIATLLYSITVNDLKFHMTIMDCEPLNFCFEYGILPPCHNQQRTSKALALEYVIFV